MTGIAGILANLSTAAIVGLSPQYPTSYQLDVKLDATAHRITGDERIEFLNPTSDTLDQVCLHLYPNAFKDTASVFCRENAAVRADVAAGNTSELKVTDIAIDGQALDSGSANLTGTLLYLRLPARLPPQQTIVITLKFDLKIPRATQRIGYNNLGNYLLSHWHPILCGYQKGVLQDFEYHYNSEFFSNFSSYDLKLDIPSDFKIGSTGEPAEISRDSSRAVWQVHADSVIDFAFACGPAFQVTDVDTMSIHLRYMLEKRHDKYLKTTDDMTRYSLAYDSKMFYNYPYKSFTLVDFECGSTGMELPGMVVISFPGARSLTLGKKILITAIAHELTHEWFYATIATNEAYEPFLDEGITSYVTDRLLESGGDTLTQMSFFGYEFKYSEFERLAALISKANYPIDLKSWDYPDEMSYGMSVYSRSTLVLDALENLLGRARMDSALSFYANEYRFRHPDIYDFKNAISERGGINLDRFYDQFISGTARVDYGIISLSYKAISGSEGKFDVDITVERRLDGILPQKISLFCDDGSRIDTLWNGEARTTVFKFPTSSKPKYAELNAGNAYSIDENIANNTLYFLSLGSRLLSFEWDTVFMVEFFLSFIL